MSEILAFSATPMSAAGGPVSALANREGVPVELHDPNRLRKAMDAHFDFVWRSLRRLGLSPDRADDAAQQVFLVFSTRLADVALDRERAFLYGTATRVASDIRKSAPVRREIATDMNEPQFAEAHVSQAPQPDALLEQRRARALLETALGELSAELREVLVLYEIEDASTQEIAEIIGIPQGTVKSRLRFGREAFEAVVARLMRKGSNDSVHHAGKGEQP